jgi:hypothetical protein
MMRLGSPRAVGHCSSSLVRLCRAAAGCALGPQRRRAPARAWSARDRAEPSVCSHLPRASVWVPEVCCRRRWASSPPSLSWRARAAVATEGRLSPRPRLHHLRVDAPRGSLSVLGTHSGVPRLSQVSRRSCGLSCACGVSPCAAGWRRCCRCCRSAAQHDDQEGFLSRSSCVRALCRTPEHVVRVQAPSLDLLALALHSARAARVQQTLRPCHEMKEYANKDNRTIKQRGPKGLLCEESESVVKSRASLLDQKLVLAGTT